MITTRTKRWWRERFVTLMVIPERTRRVHKVILPFFILKLGIVVFSLGTVFMMLIGVDYIHVLGQLAENKRLKGENYRLRQDLQLIRNKVDSMEATIERVSNYAKKLQLLTGQSDPKAAPKGQAPEMPDLELEREPAGKPARRSSKLMLPVEREPAAVIPASAPLPERIDQLQNAGLAAESKLSGLQVYFLGKSAMMAATPSLIPINGWVSSSFGYRRHPYDGSYRLHAGVDLVAEPGTPVRAPADGLIIFSGQKSGYGKVVVIDHGYGIRTLYGHGSKFFVNPGTRVKRGQKIAEVGSTGMSTGPHLHYEIRKNGVPV
ncbi:M23 family metallopeptidase, partial [bacterium]|nr:M23 family metallopeptidase [bacterium]